MLGLLRCDEERSEVDETKIAGRRLRPPNAARHEPAAPWQTCCGKVSSLFLGF
jgi:hypothetical protein